MENVFREVIPGSPNFGHRREVSVHVIADGDTAGDWI